MSVFDRIDAAALEGDVRAVARRLLGMRLVRFERGDSAVARAAPARIRTGFIVETEAYHQVEPASHSYGGPKGRNRPTFEKPGTAYVYFIYGSSYCFNVVCEAPGTGAAVLIRALEPELGVPVMAAARGRDDMLTNGPGRLCQALDIDRRLDGIDLLSDDGLYLARGLEILDDRIDCTPRIGITKAAELPWRYLVLDNPHVSGRSPAQGRATRKLGFGSTILAGGQG